MTTCHLPAVGLPQEGHGLACAVHLYTHKIKLDSGRTGNTFWLKFSTAYFTMGGMYLCLAKLLDTKHHWVSLFPDTCVCSRLRWAFTAERAFSSYSQWEVLSSRGGQAPCCSDFSCGAWARGGGPSVLAALWLSRCGALGLVAPWHVNLPGPGIERLSPAWAGGFLTTGTPGKILPRLFFIAMSFLRVWQYSLLLLPLFALSCGWGWAVG